mmetsp:Transcript_43927/g.139975  ORF Transcript_43927/g.139975 Transcript_43927/m.139975 type:complete len:251 (-) Transcript_43927:118-870(-)
MMSSLVITPMVRSPRGSAARAMLRASELARSTLAGETARMMQLPTCMYVLIMRRICSSMSLGWSPTGTLVMPGRSTRVMVSTCGEQILSRICLWLIPLLDPVSRSVSRSISSRIFWKSVNFCPGRWRNSPHSTPEAVGGACTSCSTRGRRVQMSGPRGRKSRPTSASRTEDLPLDWLPTTATWGRSKAMPSRPPLAVAKMSWSLLMTGIRVLPSAWDSRTDEKFAARARAGGCTGSGPLLGSGEARLAPP